MNGLLLRAGRVLKYRVIHRAQRYTVKHSCGWIEAETITGATVAEVEEKIREALAPVVHALSVERIAAGFRLPEDFGDKMRDYLRMDCSIIDRATGRNVEDKKKASSWLVPSNSLQ
jgi:hypothetical protein